MRCRARQRLTYRGVFGDPLNRVRIRLGLRSATTTAMCGSTAVRGNRLSITDAGIAEKPHDPKVQR